jgi:hypothetical protein
MEKWDTDPRTKATLLRSMADSNKVQTVNLLFSAVVDFGEMGCVNASWMELAQDCVHWETFVLTEVENYIVST